MWWPQLFSSCLLPVDTEVFIFGDIKMRKELHLWLPPACQMVKQLYIDHTPCALFTKRQLLQYPPLFSTCLFQVVVTEATICHW
jgi:hypothetical protein